MTMSKTQVQLALIEVEAQLQGIHDGLLSHFEGLATTNVALLNLTVALAAVHKAQQELANEG